jgi:glycine reductase
MTTTTSRPASSPPTSTSPVPARASASPPVKDVIEPRVKVEGPGGEFPGVIAKVDTVGTGKTHVLRGMAVVTAGKIVGFQEGIIDMTGPGADYTPFSKLNNLVMVCEPVDGVKQHEYEHAVRIAGLRAATFIGELGRNVQPDETKTFETYGIKEGMEKFPEPAARGLCPHAAEPGPAA